MRQYDIPLIGEFKTVANSAAFYLTLVIWVNTGTTAYSKYLAYVPWLSFPMFLLLMGLFVGLMMLLDFKLAMRPSYRFGNQQSYNAQNPVRIQLDRVEEKQSEADKRLERIEKALLGLKK